MSTVAVLSLLAGHVLDRLSLFCIADPGTARAARYTRSGSSRSGHHILAPWYTERRKLASLFRAAGCYSVLQCATWIKDYACQQHIIGIIWPCHAITTTCSIIVSILGICWPSRFPYTMDGPSQSSNLGGQEDDPNVEKASEPEAKQQRARVRVTSRATEQPALPHSPPQTRTQNRTSLSPRPPPILRGPSREPSPSGWPSAAGAIASGRGGRHGAPRRVTDGPRFGFEHQPVHPIVGQVDQQFDMSPDAVQRVAAIVLPNKRCSSRVVTSGDCRVV